MSDDLVTLLRRSMPFQVVPDHLLREIAAISRRATYRRGDAVYEEGDPADEILVVVSGKVEHVLGAGSGASDPVKIVGPGDIIGWAAMLDNQPKRLARTLCIEDAELIRINGEELLGIFQRDPDTGNVVMSRFAAMITRDFSLPESFTRVRRIVPALVQAAGDLKGMALTMFRVSEWLKSPRPYLMVIGFSLFLGFWFMAVEVWKLPRFTEMPGLTTVVKEWTNPNPVYGLSIYTPEYYEHIWVSVRRVSIAFILATTLGVSLGLFMGWSSKFKEYTFPLFETLRPIPILAWVPLAIIMFRGDETPVIFLTFLASFFATTLNTMLGVESIEESYVRAAYCLGAKRWQVFRQVIIPGALPFIFTGLQISVGVAWFSLVAAEMVSGQFGLGYVINTSYVTVKYPTIIIGMITLGAVGYVTSAGVRIVGDHLMQWRVRELALGARG